MDLLTDKEKEVITTVVPGSPSWNMSKLKNLWNGFHNTIFIGLIFTLLGVSIGVKVSKEYYKDRVSEVIATGAFLFDKKVYTINPKI